MSAQRLVVRPAAVAGSFYPADAPALERVLTQSFAAARPPASGAPVPKLLIVPHAGYAYSGPVAGSGYLRLAPSRTSISRVVLVGPNHRVPLLGAAVSSADAFATPLGLVHLDRRARRAALAVPGVVVDDEVHRQEHSLEVHLPFLQVVLESFEVLPIVVGRMDPKEVAALLDLLWGGPDTLIVVSTDLSHYLPYDSAVEADRHTVAAITALDVASIHTGDACGAFPLCGALVAVARRGLRVEQIDVRNSGDTSGDRGSVVGYGAFAAF
jgi:MEMO1 family protein